MSYYAGFNFYFQENGEQFSARQYEDEAQVASIAGYARKERGRWKFRLLKSIPYEHLLFQKVVRHLNEIEGAHTIKILLPIGYTKIDIEKALSPKGSD